MDVTLHEIDRVVNTLRDHGIKGKSFDIVKAIRKQYYNDRDISHRSRDVGKLEHFLNAIYGDVLPLKAKEHYYAAIDTINQKLQELYFKGDNPKAVGINPENHAFIRLAIDQKRESRLERENDMRKISEIQNEFASLRKKLHLEENKRGLDQKRIVELTEEIQRLRQQIFQLADINKKDLGELRIEQKLLRENLQEIERFLKFVVDLEKWLDTFLVFRFYKRMWTQLKKLA
jgi:hypothetical protein